MSGPSSPHSLTYTSGPTWQSLKMLPRNRRIESGTIWLRRVLFSLGVLLLFSTLGLALFINTNRRLKSSHSKPDIDHGASGKEPIYGFDLSTGYGTAAAHSDDGSILNIGQVHAKPAYVEMMERLSRKGTSITGTRDWPCYPYTWAVVPDIYRWPVIWRQIRKRIGLPSTTDVALLIELLENLLQLQAEHDRDHAAKDVVTTFPNHQSLCEEDITDALEYLNISPLGSRFQLYSQPHEFSAAYAGYGMGLCKNTTDLDACRAEERAMPRNNTLAISFTKEALMVEAFHFTTAYEYALPNSYRMHPVNYDLGLGSLAGYPDPADYWSFVRAKIDQQVQYQKWYDHRIDVVILYGGEALSKELRAVVKDVLEGSHNDPPIFAEDPTYVAARGAVELAIRALEERARGGISTSGRGEDRKDGDL